VIDVKLEEIKDEKKENKGGLGQALLASAIILSVAWVNSIFFGKEGFVLVILLLGTIAAREKVKLFFMVLAEQLVLLPMGLAIVVIIIVFTGIITALLYAGVSLGLSLIVASIVTMFLMSINIQSSGRS